MSSYVLAMTVSMTIIHYRDTLRENDLPSGLECRDSLRGALFHCQKTMLVHFKYSI